MSINGKDGELEAEIRRIRDPMNVVSAKETDKPVDDRGLPHVEEEIDDL